MKWQQTLKISSLRNSNNTVTGFWFICILKQHHFVRNSFHRLHFFLSFSLALIFGLWHPATMDLRSFKVEHYIPQDIFLVLLLVVHLFGLFSFFFFFGSDQISHIVSFFHEHLFDGFFLGGFYICWLVVSLWVCEHPLTRALFILLLFASSSSFLSS